VEKIRNDLRTQDTLKALIWFKSKSSRFKNYICTTIVSVLTIHISIKMLIFP
jgi:hypothetical protein